MNGVKHTTFKKTYRPLPQFLRLPEGFTVKVKNDAPENRKCFLCDGDHFQRECPYRQPPATGNQIPNKNNQKPNENPENKGTKTHLRTDENQSEIRPDEQKQTNNESDDQTTCAKQLYTNNYSEKDDTSYLEIGLQHTELELQEPKTTNRKRRNGKNQGTQSRLKNRNQ